MPYDKNIHHRRSIRMRDYDYSYPGLYFITICTHEKQCLFGHVHNGKMILNGLGNIVHDEWLNTAKIRKEIDLYEFVIMPNHIHGIIGISCRGVRRTPYVFGYEYNPVAINDCQKGVRRTPLQTQSKTIGALIRGYKCAVSKRVGKSIWQRNYWEHVIRDGDDYREIANYINGNPRTWDADKLFVKQLNEFNKQFETM